MKRYQGLFILCDDADEKKHDAIRSVVADLGGTVASLTRLGQNTLARPINKRESGSFVLMIFDIEPEQISAMLSRYRSNENILRVNIVVDKRSSDAKREIESQSESRQ